MNDFFGNEICVGDFIAYGTSYSNNVSMNVALVKEIKENSIRCIKFKEWNKSFSKEFSIVNVKRCIVVTEIIPEHVKKDFFVDFE